MDINAYGIDDNYKMNIPNDIDKPCSREYSIKLSVLPKKKTNRETGINATLFCMKIPVQKCNCKHRTQNAGPFQIPFHSPLKDSGEKKNYPL